MLANQAAGAGDTAATAPETGATAESAAQAHQSASASRLAAVLSADEEPTPGDELLPATGEHSNGTQENDDDRTRPDGAGTSETAGAGDDSSRKTGSEGNQNGAPGKKAEDPDEKLTEDQRTQWPPEALERIHKLTGKRNEAKQAREAAEQTAQQLTERLRQAEEKLKTAQPVVVPPTAHDPLADVQDEQGLTRAVAELEQGLEWATRNAHVIEDVTIGKDAAGNPITRDFTPEEMTDQRLFYERALRNAVPARKDYIARRQLVEQEVRERHAEVLTNGTPEHQEMTELLQLVPELTRLPHYQLAIAWAISGRKADLAAREAVARQNGNGQGAASSSSKVKPELAPFLRQQPVKSPAVVQARGENSTAPGNGADKKTVQQAAERVQAIGGEEAEDDFIASLRDSQRSRSAVAV